MMVAPIPRWEKPPRLLEGRVAAGKQEQCEPRCPHTFRTAYLKTAMMAALMRPEMGTVTNQAMKMLRKRRQSTAFLERSQPTETTEPTCPRSQGTAQHHSRKGCPLPRNSLVQGCPGKASAMGPRVLLQPLGTQQTPCWESRARSCHPRAVMRAGHCSTRFPMAAWQSPGVHQRGFVLPSPPRVPPHPWTPPSPGQLLPPHIEMQMAELGPEGWPVA